MSKTKTQKYLDGLAWDQVVWHDSYSKVRRMQKRIYKASQKGDKGKVTFLQKLLMRNPHAKLIAVQIVTTLNKGKRTVGIDRFVPTSNKHNPVFGLWPPRFSKTRVRNTGGPLEIAKSLALNGKATPVRRVWLPKPGKVEKRPLGIPTIKDRAKQALCKLVLEPQWEAKFEPNSYGFRPGRNAQDAIEAIFLNLRVGQDKFIFNADIHKCFDRTPRVSNPRFGETRPSRAAKPGPKAKHGEINHEALLKKLDTFPLMESQVSAWLKAGIFDEYKSTPGVYLSPTTTGTPQGGVISPLLANIAFHGLEEHLLEFVSQRKMPKPYTEAAKGKRAKRAALGFVRYAHDFVIIHRNVEILQLVIEETKNWLAGIGLSMSEEKSSLKKASQTFKFLGFQITYVKNRATKKFRVRITPSKDSVIRLVSKVRAIIQHNKAASAYQLIGKIRPIILGWANYFKYCECKKTFWKVDNIIFQQIRAWVFRRAIRQGRRKVKESYFPSGNTYQFQGRSYKSDWVLIGSKKLAGGHKIITYLPKISWISSEKYVKIKGDASVYNGDEVYWALRTPR